jgi:PilZ domain
MSSGEYMEGVEALRESTGGTQPRLSRGRKGSTKERRRSQRLPLGIPIFVRGVDERGKEFLEFTTTLNISGSGALLVMRRSLPLASKVLLEIPAAPLPRVAAAPQFVRNLQAHIVRITFSKPSYVWALQLAQPL